jgi:hypothetical protein
MAALKGAFINLGAGILGLLPNIVIFQFNPERVTRTPKLIQPPAPPKGSGATDSTQQPGDPSESYSFTLKLDAADQLAQGNSIANSSGILPALSALELLMIPKASLKPDLAALLGGGKSSSFKLTPVKLDTILFFWGPFRIFPVTINSLSINETQYDPQLNPIRAEVSVTLQVLTPNQMDPGAILAIGAYTYSEGVKQVMAALNLANTASLGLSGSLSLSL